MKPGTIAIGNASLHIGYSQIIAPNKRGKVRELTDFFVPENMRGQGEGTTLIQAVCDDADNEGLMLLIIADDDRLAAFYSRFDFAPLSDDKLRLMLRMPQIPPCN